MYFRRFEIERNKQKNKKNFFCFTFFIFKIQVNISPIFILLSFWIRSQFTRVYVCWMQSVQFAPWWLRSESNLCMKMCNDVAQLPYYECNAIKDSIVSECVCVSVLYLIVNCRQIYKSEWNERTSAATSVRRWLQQVLWWQPCRWLWDASKSPSIQIICIY